MKTVNDVLHESVIKRTSPDSAFAVSKVFTGPRHSCHEEPVHLEREFPLKNRPNIRIFE
jgi:hypothetical protein